MSNWLSEYSPEEQKQVDAVNAKGLAHKPTETTEDSSGLFSLAAPIRGMGAGFAKVGDTIAAPFDAVTDRVGYAFKDVGTEEFIEPYSAYKENKQKARADLVYESIDYLQDKENTGTVGNIAFSLGDYATRAVVGSAVGGIAGAAAVTGGSETNYVYGDLTRDGVDEETALKVALTDGAVAAVSTALPMSYGFKGTGGVIKDGLLSVGGASGLSIGGQAASGAILESEGYDKQAKKYEVTAESVTTDILLNTLFFGAARGAGKYLNNPDVTPEQQQAALVLNELEFEETLAPVKPANPVQANNHIKNLDTATEAIRMGRPVNVVHPVKGEDKQKPINYDTMALPTNAKTIARKAQQAGIPPNVALTIAHIETGGSFSHTAKNPTSSAHGLFQVLDKSWSNLGGGDRSNIDEQIRIGFKHMKQAESHIKKSIGRELQPHEHYLGHLLGPGGASAVLKADPNAKLIDVVRKYDPKNANDIVKNNAMEGMTVGQAIGKWRNKWNSLSARYGGNGTSTAIGMDGSSYDMAYEVKSLDELIASNDLAYGVNPLYPSELQPRDRTREASRQQIERMAENLKPEWLGESNMLSNGAPIIGMDNVVESGNGRTLAIAKAYESGRAEEYRAFLEQYASERGIDIAGINNPVLVRTRLTDTDRTQFAKLANESDVAQYSATERAVSDSDRLPDASLLKINNDGSINLDGSMDFVRGFVGSLPKSEQGTVITGDGRLSQEGKRRIESAMMQRTYEDSSLIGRMAENLDDDSKTVLSALLRAAPQLAQLDALVKQGGRHQNSIAKDLAQAAQKLRDLKANGQTVPDYLNQGQLIDDGLSPGARDFLNVFDQNNRSAKAIGENIQGKIDEIEAMGDPRQGSLFGDGPEESAALDIIMQNPDQQISVSRMRPDGEMEEITMSLRERLDELEAEARQAQEDTLAAQTAISCALQFGE
ncbi:lytic transglycosylase domain-containing protein [Acinetobacter sp. ASP199]|uniref:lytic transglycosylase domain-containing protein n=1 Tax=unclassified Acinetobacter TaxID=196816 RepID=UPI001F606418|nr:lytic transglycosylase domain-containing protein [Acinetobacter sp. ASP199]UNT60469.1 lytic transglycosylase domain-containing protein [Acinetobacter sp. ASP199]